MQIGWWSRQCHSSSSSSWEHVYIHVSRVVLRSRVNGYSVDSNSGQNTIMVTAYHSSTWLNTNHRKEHWWGCYSPGRLQMNVSSPPPIPGSWEGVGIHGRRLMKQPSNTSRYRSTNKHKINHSREFLRPYCPAYRVFSSPTNPLPAE